MAKIVEAVSVDFTRRYTKRDEREKLIAELTAEIEIPKYYEVDRHGVKFLDENICISTSPIWVSHLIRNANNRDWCPVVRGINHNFELVENELEYDLIFGRPAQLASMLASNGFHVIHGTEKLISEYLNSFTKVPRLIRAERIGWFMTENGDRVFNLPNRSIGATSSFDFSRLKRSKELAAMHSRGTLKGWRKNVFTYLKAYPLLRFGILLALTGPLLRLLNGETFGVHICGATSTGKTTLALLASSVWGAANRPGAGPSMIYSFNQTVNALESLCQGRNDTMIVFDEIGSHDSGSFTTVVYRIAGGVQKGRLGRDSALRECAEWQFTFLTTGERSVMETLAEDTREGRVKSGQLVRLVNIETDNKIIIAESQEEAADVVQEIRSSLNENYGTAGPIFVERLVAALKSGKLELGDVLSAWDETAKELTSPDMENHQARCMRHLALVDIAGQVASLLKVLPFTTDEVRECVTFVKDMYLSSPDVLSDAAREALNIKEFIEEHMDNFRHYDIGSAAVRNQVGYIHCLDGEYLYLFSSTTLKRIVKSRNLKRVLNFLADRNFLHLNDPGKFQAKIKHIDFSQTLFDRKMDIKGIKNNKRQVRFYAVSETLLQWDGTERIDKRPEDFAHTKAGKKCAKHS